MSNFLNKSNLQVQRHLQLRIEAQGKYLQAVLEKAQETLGRQNLGTVGIEAAKVQLSELVSKVSTQCLNSTLSELKQIQGLCPQNTQTTQPNDCSMDSCLSCEGSQKEQEMHNNEMLMRRQCNGTSLFEPILLPKTEPNWIRKETERSRMFQVERSSITSTGLSIGIGLQREEGNESINGYSHEGRDIEDYEEFVNRKRERRDSIKLPYYSPKLDLNSHDENDSSSGFKQLDLNGFSWT